MKRKKMMIAEAAAPAVPLPTAANAWVNIALAALIAVICFVAYSNSIPNKFVWDDKFLIEENRTIESFANIPYAFSHELFRLEDGATGYYRPIQTLSYMIDYAIWKRTPSGYRLTGVLIQALNAILVFYLSLLVLGDRWKSFVIAAVFCVHPAFVPIVAYISGRADLLGLFFSLLAIYAVIRRIAAGEKSRAVWLAPLFYALAILSKEYYIICPAFIALFIYALKKGPGIDRETKAVLVSLLVIAAVYGVLRMTALNFHQKMGGMSKIPFMTRAAVFPYILAIYAGTLLFPFNLGLEKKLVYSSLTEPRFIFSYIVPLLIVGAFYYLIRTGRRKELFFLGWFAVAILPVTNLFIPLKVFCADHWTYMAAIGFFGVIVCGAEASMSLVRVPPGARAGIGAAAVLFFALLTVRENSYWRNEEVFFSRTSQKSPHHSRAQFNMAKVYEEKGELEKALELYNKAEKESSGKDGYILNSRGMLYRMMGDLEKARQDCEAAVKASPSVAVYRNNLGGVYAELGLDGKARAEFNEALRLEPGNELASKNLEILNGIGGETAQEDE